MPLKRPGKTNILCLHKHLLLRRYNYSEVFEFVIMLLRHILSICSMAFRRRIVVIKITSVRCVFELWDDRTFDPSMIQGIPVNGLEKRVRLHKSSAVNTTTRDVAESLRWIDSTQATNEIAGIV